MKQRDNAHKKAAATNSPEDWRLFRSIRNRVTALIRRDKKLWEQEKLDSSLNNSEQTWRTVKSWLNWGSSGPPTQLVCDGKIVSSPSRIANIMNNFFTDKVKSLRNKIPAERSDPLSKFKEAMHQRTCVFKLKKTTEAEVLEVISQLKNSSSSGIDYIDTRTIKLIAELIAPSLVHIVNLSIETSKFPDAWKIAKVVPLLKGGTCDPLLPKSYRPVALLPIFSKILEKIVFRQLIFYLEDNKLIHPNLHGSRKGHSTSTALIQLYDQWVEDVAQGKMVGVLMCDQSAAYDLCDHRLLEAKLKLLGLDENSLSWVNSYLNGRKQHCFIEGHLSEQLTLMDCGVPQGSIGGPLLWLCFTIDQPDITHDHSVERNLAPDDYCTDYDDCGQFVGYVDDGAFSYAHRDPTTLSRVLTSKFENLRTWMINNKLVINPDKTHLLVIGSKRSQERRNEVSLDIGDSIIQPSVTEKLLGALISQDLKWNQHIQNNQGSLMAQITSRINGLKRIARSSSFKTRRMVADGIVLSKMVYLINLWGGAQLYLLKAIYVQQMAAARVVCGFQCYGWSNRKILEKVGWLSVRQLVFYHTFLQTHRTLLSKTPSPLFKSISKEYTYNTRNAAAGSIRYDESFVTDTFKNRARIVYNQVPIDVRTGSLGTVKKKLKAWIKANVPMDFG